MARVADNDLCSVLTQITGFIDRVICNLFVEIFKGKEESQVDIYFSIRFFCSLSHR